MITKFWNAIGRVCFWLTSPAILMYLKSGARTRIIVESGGEIIVVKMWLDDGKWSLPGGGLHRGEDPLRGVLRELKEETGVNLAANKIRHFGAARYKRAGLNFPYIRYVAQLSHKQELTKQKGEIIEARWMSIDQLNVQNAHADLLDSLAAWNTTVTSDTM